MKPSTKREYRVRRHLRLRKKVIGTAERPRMSVFTSSRHMYVQFINDTDGHTIASASTMQGEMRGDGSVNREKAAKLGQVAAEKVKEQGVNQVIFDRGGFAYSSCIKALADAAREAGLEF